MTAPLLDIRDLSISFTQGGKETLAVDHVSLSVEKGKTLALVGEFGLRQIDHRLVDRAAAAAFGASSLGKHLFCRR